MKDILITLREENRYTQTAMAKLLGISRQAYMKYETGEVEPPVEVVRKLKNIYGVTYEILIDNRVDLITSVSETPEKEVTYKTHSDQVYSVASPAAAYGSSKKYSSSYGNAENSNGDVQNTVKQTIQNSSLDEFATMLFSVAASLQTENKLTTEEKLAKFEVYAKLAEAEIDIANGDKGEDADTAFSKLMGEKWTKKYIK